MGTLVTKSQARNTKADYTGEGLTINVNYSEDAISKTLTSLDGSIYKTEDMSYAGDFNGRMKDGEIQYSLSNVKSSDMAVVIAAIDDIETQIKAAEQPVNQE